MNKKLKLITTKFFGTVSENRNLYIGGSDAGAIMNANPWKSRYKLWLEKTEQIAKEDISDKLQVWFGTEEEEIVAKRFTLETDKKVKRSNLSYTCEEYPFLIGHIDRLVVGEKSGLECKTTSAYNLTDYENGDVPPSYYWQCMHYLMLTGLERWYIAVKKDNNRFYILQIDRDEEKINQLLEEELHFWDLVKRKEAPEIDGSNSTSEAIAKQFNSVDDEIIELSDEKIDTILKSLDDINAEIKKLSDIKTAYQNDIKFNLGNHQKAFTKNYTINWAKSTSTRIDKKALDEIKNAYPEVYQKYAKTSEIRTLRIVKNKGE